tara:strand:+ start:148 stop:705 length:558 start_codon:yes stop_codon:yes gene_type:complete
MSGGGKGGSETTTSGIPDWVQAPAERNIARAETAQKVGYMPYYGPDIAAFNPTQNAAFNSNIGAAEAFGMVPQGSLTAMQGMAPQANTYAGGLQAYSSGDLFDQALAELKTRRPGQVAQYDKMFVDPFTGAQPEPVVAPGPKQGDVIQIGQNTNIPAQNRNFQPMWNPAPEGYVSMGNGFAMYKG